MVTIQLSVEQAERLIDCLDLAGDGADDSDIAIMDALQDACEAEKNRLEGLPV